MIRVRSTDLWFNAPGIVACYQPVAAPDSLAARQNVGNDLRLAGRHTARPGAAIPAHSPVSGWKFNHTTTTEYFDTGFVPFSGTTMLIRVASCAWISYHCAAGCNIATESRRFSVWWDGTASSAVQYFSGGTVTASPRLTTGLLGIAGQQGYRNGIADGAAASAWSGATTATVWIGRENGAVSRFGCNGDVPAFLLSAITLTPAHMAQYSRQMAYCHVNPDWNAWGRRRRYYYAQTVTAGAVGIYGKRGAVALPGGVRIEAVQ